MSNITQLTFKYMLFNIS